MPEPVHYMYSPASVGCVGLGRVEGWRSVPAVRHEAQVRRGSTYCVELIQLCSKYNDRNITLSTNILSKSQIGT